MSVKVNPNVELSHPLSPLSEVEIEKAVQIVKEQQQLSEHVRFMSVMLHEPKKSEVLNYKPGNTVDRQVFLVILDDKELKTFEKVVNLTSEKVDSYEYIPGVQPNVALEEFEQCEELVKSHPDFVSALQKRGIDNPDLMKNILILVCFLFILEQYNFFQKKTYQLV
ncbi:hypothetical protein [Lysinibacillus xylanilyticus]|uniref:hypothetical protein n=1 Tax=Lysinibacillus xylanilyticus TaxID=582475 RepID=UPI003830A0F6